MKEDYVNFEIAKLLKEKGFDEYCRAEWLEYIDGPSKGKTYLTECGSGLQHDSCSNTSLKKFNYDGQMYYAAPTLQMAMKYLREKYNIHIEIRYQGNKEYPYKYYINNLKADKEDNKHKFFGTHYMQPINENKTYESACESAIEWCLTNLI